MNRILAKTHFLFSSDNILNKIELFASTSNCEVSSKIVDLRQTM